ncbi:TPR-like protein [Byssothecium circinans]|uniref:TPR-like protein n=1 Tax=Byssothecium circinans TaxID=147558 RepID=A0A6A5TNF1_9PLEO|nr:TPR-like protein [Byssothecium circinans]
MPHHGHHKSDILRSCLTSSLHHFSRLQMSGLEAVGVAANIIQLVDTFHKVATRLNDFREKTGSLPNSLRHLKAQLPVFVNVVQSTKTAIDENRVSDAAAKALTPLIQECEEQIQKLDDIVVKLLPGDGDTGRRRARKALSSLTFEAEIAETEAVIRKYMDAITHQTIASAGNKDTVSSQRPSPTFVNKPFQRDVDFVERDALAEIILRTHAPDPIARFALVGLGGVGKSQVAIEFAYRTRSQFPDAWVFWVHAGSVTRFEEDYRKIAQAVRLPGWDDKGIDIFKRVFDWLCNEANGKWFMIIDNADDMEVFNTVPSRRRTTNDGAGASVDAQIRDYLPKSSTGSIVITSRSKNVAFDLTGNANHYLEMEEMNEAEAILLLDKKLKGPYSESEKLPLVEALEFIPLAISQAAAYISRRAPRVTISSYIDDLEKSDRQMAQLLSEDATESHRERQRSNSIMTTWHISFQHVRHLRPSAARLLSLMSLFDRQRIPETILLGQYEDEDAAREKTDPPPTPWLRFRSCLRRRRRHVPECANQAPTPSNFYDDWTTLSDFSFIKTTADGHTLSMHRLVQLATQRWLEIHDVVEHEHWIERYVLLMIKNIHRDDIVILPHALRAITIETRIRETFYSQVHLLQKVGELFCLLGRWKDAEDTLYVSMTVLYKFGSEDNEITLQGLNLLGWSLISQEKFAEAEPYLRRAFTGGQKLFGIKDDRTAQSAEWLAQALSGQGKLEESEALSKYRGGRYRVSTFEPGSKPALLWKMINAERCGDYATGEVAARAALDMNPQPWGLDDVSEIHFLSCMLLAQEKLKEAEVVLRQSEAILRANPTVNNLQKCENYVGLADVLLLRDNHEEAEPLYREVLQCLHDGTGTETQTWIWHSREGLATVLAKKGEFEQAIEMAQQVVEEIVRSSGGSVWDRPIAFHSFAEIMRICGRNEEAIIWYERAYTTVEEGPPNRYYMDKFRSDLEKARELVRGEKKDEHTEAPKTSKRTSIGESNGREGLPISENGSVDDLEAPPRKTEAPTDEVEALSIGKGNAMDESNATPS